RLLQSPLHDDESGALGSKRLRVVRKAPRARDLYYAQDPRRWRDRDRGRRACAHPRRNRSKRRPAASSLGAGPRATLIPYFIFFENSFRARLPPGDQTCQFDCRWPTSTASTSIRLTSCLANSVACSTVATKTKRSPSLAIWSLLSCASVSSRAIESASFSRKSTAVAASASTHGNCSSLSRRCVRIK